jgi:hypothetical protein
MARMGASRPDCEPLLLFKLLWRSFDFWQLFLFLVRFIPNLLGDSTNLREGLTTESVVLQWRAAELLVNHSRRFYESPRIIDTFCIANTEKKGKLENHGLSCQSSSEILQITKRVWYEMHQYFHWPSNIKEISLKMKNQKRFLFRSRKIHSSPKKVKISCDSPFY